MCHHCRRNITSPPLTPDSSSLSGRHYHTYWTEMRCAITVEETSHRHHLHRTVHHCQEDIIIHIGNGGVPVFPGLRCDVPSL
ncbi:hypothetical protein J6590_098369 [Homalodisca vitripennis]|nr:hypothetical protein J6590_098369 [Homalodisca vitripennis]